MPAFDNRQKVETAEPAQGKNDSKPPDDGFSSLNGPSIDRPAEKQKIADEAGAKGSKPDAVIQGEQPNDRVSEQQKIEPVSDSNKPDDGFGDLRGPAIDRPGEQKKISEGGGGSGDGPPDDGFGDLQGPAIDRPAEQEKQSGGSSGEQPDNSGGSDKSG